MEKSVLDGVAGLGLGQSPGFATNLQSPLGKFLNYLVSNLSVVALGFDIFE